MKAVANLAIGFALVALLTVFVSPFFSYGNPKEAAKRTACLSNVKQQATATMMYAEDKDGRFPRCSAWMDDLRPYGRDGRLFHHSGPNWLKTYGYAFNSTLSAARPPKAVETTPLTYDSTTSVRNATDAVASLPSPGRHDGKNSVAYADGHARAVTMP